MALNASTTVGIHVTGGSLHLERVISTAHHANALAPLGENDVTWITEVFSGTTQLGTHLDALNHLQIGDPFICGLHEGRVRALRGVRLDWAQDNGRPVMKEIPGSEFEIPCELVLLALGFLGPETDTVVSQLGCELTERGNVKAGPDYQTTVPGVFACGDARRGQSLVVWAIWEGREAARGVDAYLMGETSLPASPEL